MDDARTVAGRYRLLSRIGSGGMGTVWRAHDDVLDREVAVKAVGLPAGLPESERAVLVERTRREARHAAGLDHPSAVTVFDVVEDGGSPYLVMELVEARTLAEVVRDDGPLDPRRAAEVGLALLGALEAAHARGIVHRDVKPSNVMLRDDGRVVLTDFGIAVSTGDPSLTSAGTLVGSPAYLAPERARGEQPGPPADLWSLGATLYSAVEGRPPYDRPEALATLTALLTEEPAPYERAGALGAALDGLLVKDPAQRFDAADARAFLQAAADAGPVRRTARSTAPLPVAEPAADDRPAARPVAAAAAPPADRSSPRTAVLAGAAALVLVAGGVALALTAGDDDPPGARAAAPVSSTGSSPDGSPASDTADDPTPAPDDAAPPPDAVADPDPDPDPEPVADRGGAAPVPEGWSTDTGGPGWTVALPPGYRSTGGGEYVQSATGRTLRVTTGEGQPDAVADREGQEESFRQRHPSYQRIRIDPVEYRGYEAADWEFTYEGLHALNRVFVVGERGYSLFFQTPRGDYPAARDEVLQVFRSFRPAGT